MKRTYIQVKKLNDLLGDMTNSMVMVNIWKSITHNMKDRIFTTTMYSKDLFVTFGDYFVYDITSATTDDGYGCIKLSICINRPDGEWQEV